MRSCVIENGGAASGEAVCVILMNFADVGWNVIDVLAPVPAPAATSVHVVPFSDVSIL